MPHCVALITLLIASASTGADPYRQQVTEQLAHLDDPSPSVRARAAELLGFLRTRQAEPRLIEALQDPQEAVRLQAAMALGWCAGRAAVGPLIDALDDRDWTVRQAAHVSLTNLTGMEREFDANAPRRQRRAVQQQWADWWSTVPPDRPPPEVLKLLESARAVGFGRQVTASSTYKGPPEVLLDGQLGPEYWQTKQVPFPQWCTVDLGQVEEIDQVTVHQYGPEFVMTDYELAVSVDNRQFDIVRRAKETTPVALVVRFPRRPVRFVRVTSFASLRPTYPTTFLEIVAGSSDAAGAESTAADWRLERAFRALGSLGGQGASQQILDALGESPTTSPRYRPAIRAGLRALGRLGDEAGLAALVRLLDHPFWARHAAAALGEFGDRRAIPALLDAYPRYAKDLAGADPADVPADDKMGFPSEDRMLETPYEIVLALARLPWDDPQHVRQLRALAPRIAANLPGDHDTFVLYEIEVGHRLTRYLLERGGLRQEACEQAFTQLGLARRVPSPQDSGPWSKLPALRISSWLPCVCTEPEDLPRLEALLEHDNLWVRINAAKTMAWLGDARAIPALVRVLDAAKAEADFGYSGTFKDEEYDDPSPRWREGLIRALGLLGAVDQTPRIVGIMNDERSVVEIRMAAAQALADLGTEAAIEALREAAVKHPFLCVRNAARDAVRTADSEIAVDDAVDPPVAGSLPAARPPAARGPSSDGAGPAGGNGRPDDPARLLESGALVFIKGDNNLPNTLGTVEQADRWRQTYVVTDAGPAYRPGDNLYVLSPPRPDGQVTPLTQFADGYVADPELSWDATHVVFARRGQDDPWWHVWRVNVDGSGLSQLTKGPYHDVGPCYLADGRIVFSSSRSGIRDEYHGYPCTALHVMEADGGDIHPIATNIGRDNEPVLLPDGRIAFSRLEVFYSRNKTELTLHAARPDGTQDRVLYGPERRLFWRQLNHGPPTPADGQEAPLTHRVLRMTQPQPMPDGRQIVVATQAGLVLVGTSRYSEQLISPDYKTRAYTTPWPLSDGTILCAMTDKTPDRQLVDLGLYRLDPRSGSLELIYNDPATADFEPRPILPRIPPPVQAPMASRWEYGGSFLCSSVFATQEPQVAERGRYVRLIEGVPVVARHSTHNNPEPVWKNHGGTFARVLGTVPLAADGSFHIQVPADRLLHHQVLDSDRRVLGNQLTWIYTRPGEVRSCVGCHERPETAARSGEPLAAHQLPLPLLPRGDEFTYRAKAWFKGHLPPEIEERTRTVRAVNLFGR